MTSPSPVKEGWMVSHGSLANATALLQVTFSIYVRDNTSTIRYQDLNLGCSPGRAITLLAGLFPLTPMVTFLLSVMLLSFVMFSQSSNLIIRIQLNVGMTVMDRF